MMIDVSVIIVSLNTRNLLQGCLTSVFEGSRQFTMEVLVIDNGSSDGSVEMVKGNFPEVRLVVNKKNEGFAEPNNVGMHMAGGKYLLLLNTDTIVEPGALAVLKSFLDNHPEAGACGPMLLNPDGSIQRSVKGIPDVWTHVCDMLFLDRMFPRSSFFGRGEMAYFNYGNTQIVEHLMAAAILVRREVLETVGDFDERFSIYYNDLDWCYRITHGGWLIYYVHTAQVIHYGGQTVKQVNRDLEQVEEMYNNVMLFYEKHIGPWSVVAYKLLLLVGFSLRWVGWATIRLLKPTRMAATMEQFSRKTLWVGLRFWVP